MNMQTQTAAASSSVAVIPPRPVARMARGLLIKRLQERLDRRLEASNQIRARLWAMDTDTPEHGALMAVFDAAYARYERTRKALVRTEGGKPYWKLAEERIREMEADGWVFTPAGALRRKVPKCDTASSNNVRVNVPYREAVSAHRAMLATLAEIDANPLGWVDDDIVEVMRTADNARRAVLLAVCSDAAEAAERVQYFKDFWQREAKDSDVAEQATAEIEHVTYQLSVSLKYPND